MAALEHRSAVRGAHRPDLRAKKEFATVACSRSASRAILAFSAASIFRLGFFIIVSVYHDGADPTPIKPPVPKSGSTSVRHRRPCFQIVGCRCNGKRRGERLAYLRL